VTILQQLLDAERAGRDASRIESFTSHYQRLCEQARAAGFVLHRDLEKGRVPCAHCSSPAGALSARRPVTTAGSTPATVAPSPSAKLTRPPSRPGRHRRTGTSRSIRLLAGPRR
jgi:hypothetical protein